MTFQERILSSAPRHAQLLQSLDETSKAAAAVQQTEAYISQLEAQIATETNNVEKIYWKASRERSEYEIDDFAVKPGHEDRECNKTLEARTKAERNLDTMKKNLQEAQGKLPLLYETATFHTTLQSELSSLYDSLFDDPRFRYPPFLTLEIAQSILLRAQASQSQCLKLSDAASQTITLLSDAQTKLFSALDNVARALSARRRGASLVPMMNTYSTFEIGLGIEGQSECDIGVERRAMVRAGEEAREAEGLIASARRQEPGLVGKIRTILVAQEDFLVSCGAAFSSRSQSSRSKPVPFNATRFKDKMEVAERDLKRAMVECTRELNAAKQRVVGLKGEVDEAEERLRDAKIGVRMAREEIFRSVVDGEDQGENVGLSMGLFGEMKPLELLPSYLP